MAYQPLHIGCFTSWDIKVYLGPVWPENVHIIVTRIQDGLAALDLLFKPRDEFFAFPHLFASPDRRICNASAIKQLFIRDVAKVC